MDWITILKTHGPGWVALVLLVVVALAIAQHIRGVESSLTEAIRFLEREATSEFFAVRDELTRLRAEVNELQTRPYVSHTERAEFMARVRRLEDHLLGAVPRHSVTHPP